MLFHVLRHIEADKGIFGIEQEFRQRLGKLGLAHAGGTQEDERARRALGVFQAGTRTAYGLGKRGYRLVLTDDALMQHRLHAQQLLGFRLGKVGNRHAGGHGDHVGHVFHLYLAHRFAGFRLPFLLGFLALGLELYLFAVQGIGALEVLRGNSLILLGAHAAQVVVDNLDLFRQHHVADAHARARLVQHVDSLVGQETVLDVTVGKVYRRLKGIVAEMHMVMLFVAVAQAFQDAHGLLHVGLLHQHGLEAALEGRILFQMLAVLVERGGADDLYLAARKGRLQDGSGIDGALGSAGTDKGMQLVDEQDDVTRLLNLLDALLQALLELAAVLRACNQRGNVQRDDADVAQQVGHLIGHDELSQALGDGRFAHARLADEQRVVLLAAREDLHHALDLSRTADNRVELAFAGLLGKVGAEFAEHALGGTGGGIEADAGKNRGSAHQIVQGATDGIAFHAHVLQHIDGRALTFAHDAQKQMLGGDIALAHLHGFAQGVLQHAFHTRGEAEVPGHIGARIGLHCLADGGQSGVVLHTQMLERLGGKTLLFLHEGKQDMLGAHVGLVQGTRLFLGEHQHLPGFIGELVEGHVSLDSLGKLSVQ